MTIAAKKVNIAQRLFRSNDEDLLDKIEKVINQKEQQHFLANYVEEPSYFDLNQLLQEQQYNNQHLINLMSN